MIIIDGFEWNVPCGIERVAEVTPSEISGMMLDKTYFNDVIGTFLRYDITLAVPPTMENVYSVLYETLTAPVDGHSFVLPYNRDTVEITARVENVQDILVYTASKKQYWKGVKFTATANHPTKTMSLEEVLTVGRLPMPEDVVIPVGAVFTMTQDGWESFETTLGRYYVAESGGLEEFPVEVGEYYEVTSEGLEPYTPTTPTTYTDADEVYY